MRARCFLKIYEISWDEGVHGVVKSTGIVRKMDELGRVVIPIELRRTLGINEKDALEIFVDNDKIILKKYEPRMACMITGQISENNLVLNDGKIVLSLEAVRQLVPIFEEYLQKQEEKQKEKEKSQGA